jgi:hypothetical protein
MVVDRSEFLSRFSKACFLAIRHAGKLWNRELPATFQLSVITATPPEELPSGKLKFLGGRLLEKEKLRNLTLEQATKLLWVDGKVPRWINVSVEMTGLESTYLNIICCDKLAKTEAEFYHRREGNPPFHVLAPLEDPSRPAPPNNRETDPVG